MTTGTANHRHNFQSQQIPRIYRQPTGTRLCLRYITDSSYCSRDHRSLVIISSHEVMRSFCVFMSHSIISAKVLNFDDRGCDTVMICSHNRAPVSWRGIRGICCNEKLCLSLAVLVVIGMLWSRCRLVVAICGAVDLFDRFARVLFFGVDRPTNSPAPSHRFDVHSLHDH